MTKTEAVKVAVNQATLKRERMAVVTHASVTSDIGADHDALPLSQVQGNTAYVVRAVVWPDGGVDYPPHSGSEPGRSTRMQTLTYKCVAHKNLNHIDNGVIYVHAWATGHQELVFGSHEHARRFAERNGCEYSRK